MSKIVVIENCWEWIGHRDREGYGKWGGLLAHRESYRLLVGPLVEGLSIDHLCGNPGCVNPTRLEQVPIRVNVLRGERGACALNARKTVCKNGHPFVGYNVIQRGRGHRACRECMNEAQRQYQRRKKGKFA